VYANSVCVVYFRVHIRYYFRINVRIIISEPSFRLILGLKCLFSSNIVLCFSV